MILGIVVAAGAGFGLSRMVISPEQAVVVEAPPEPVWADITTRDLSSVETAGGQVVAAGLVAVDFAPADLPPVVTGTPLTPGAAVGNCAVLLEISDRPLFALPGEVPAYRNLTEGDSGADVQRLQAALSTCGYRVASDGEFGDQTASAVRALYRDRGYAATENEVPLKSATQDAGTAPDADASTDAGSDIEPGADVSPSAEPIAPEVETRRVVVVPTSEVAFLPPGTQVGQIPGVGQRVQDASIQVSQGAPTFEVELPPALKLKLTAGEEASLEIDGVEYPVTIPVLPVAPAVGASGEPAFVVRFDLPAEIDASMVGREGALSVTLGDETVFDKVVPISAIRTDPSGRTYVVADVADSDPVAVEVEVVASNGGYAAIEGEVSPGDRLWLSDEG